MGITLTATAVKETLCLGEDDIKYHHRASYLLPQASTFTVFKMGTDASRGGGEL